MAGTDENTPATEQDDASAQAGDSTILVYQSPLVRVNAAEEPSLLEIARDQHAFDPKIFDESPPFFWRTVPSTQLIDAYGTRMMDDSLKNFASDATDGVSFMPAHNIRDMPIGRTVRGQYKNAAHRMGKHTEADAYTIPDLKLSSIGTNDFIRGVRAGIIHDVSIGFYGGDIRCSVCGERWWSFFGMAFNDCEHMPGMTYRKLDAKGEELDEEVVASGDVYGAHMAEISAVYDGATPGAAVVGIVRAERMLEAGRVAPELARKLEAQYRIKLPVQQNWSGADLSRAAESRAQSRRDAAQPSASQEEDMPKSDSGNQAEQSGPNTQAAGNNNPTAATPNAAAGASNDAAVAEAEQRGRSTAQQGFRTLLADCHLLEANDNRDIATIVRELGDSHQHLRDEAADGRQYREDLVTDALAEGVRALGNEFRKDDYEPLLRGAPIATIKRFRDDWKKVGDDKLSGGRHTTDGGRGESANGTAKIEFAPPPSVHRG